MSLDAIMLTVTMFDYKRPLLLTWFSFNLSMDK